MEAAERRIRSGVDLGFHLRMAYAVSTVVIISFIGCRLTSIHTDISGSGIAILVAFSMIAPLPIYWHGKGRTMFREAALVIPWELLLAIILPFPVLIAARLHMPLQDPLLGHVDQWLRVSVPGIMAWAEHHWLGNAISSTYPLLQTMVVVAALVPALVGKMKSAREFLFANLVAFAIGVPMFALIPAIGPWYYFHLAPNSAQVYCWTQFQLLRSPGVFAFNSQGVGVVCFPSFHVIWTILSASALWVFRPIRIPVALLAGMIILSTLTTGWHYFSDVLAGIAVAAISMVIAKIHAV